MKFKKIISALLVGGLLITGSDFAYANDVSVKSESDISTGNTLGRSVLYDNPEASASNGVYVSSDFATPSSNKNNINVYFKNTGTAKTTVTLYRNSGTSVGSFSVDSGSEKFKELAGTFSTTYYIKVANADGSTVKGYLRARQLD